MTNVILTINAGSSSIKFAAFDYHGSDPGLLAQGQIDGIGGRAVFSAQIIGDQSTEYELDDSHGKVDHKAATRQILDWLRETERNAHIVAVGHRVVHGGPDYAEPVVIDRAVMDDLRALTSLAPLHQPHNIAGIEAALEAFPDARQVACFDTAFHRTHDLIADTFALPRQFYDEGVRRYGFHGLSYEYIARRMRVIAPELASGRMIVAHLGNGASMCAIKDGRSVTSTMGFTALDGLPMGTRCGQLDPGVILYLMAEKKMNAEEISDLLYRQSGLKGLSGISNDMRELGASDAPSAKYAIDYFVHSIKRGVGDLAASLGGLDAIIFTAGIGEKAWPVREAVLRDLSWIGVQLDQDANRQNAQLISHSQSPVAVFVLPTDEERMIAGHTLNVAGLVRDATGLHAAERANSAA